MKLRERVEKDRRTRNREGRNYVERTESVGYLSARSLRTFSLWFSLTNPDLNRTLISSECHKNISKVNLLAYSLAFSFVRFSSGLAKIVAELATSRVAKAEKCMFGDWDLIFEIWDLIVRFEFFESSVWIEVTWWFNEEVWWIVLIVLLQFGRRDQRLYSLHGPVSKPPTYLISSLCDHRSDERIHETRIGRNISWHDVNSQDGSARKEEWIWAAALQYRISSLNNPDGTIAEDRKTEGRKAIPILFGHSQSKHLIDRLKLERWNALAHWPSLKLNRCCNAVKQNINSI